MPDHSHPEYAMVRDLNGFGQCVNQVKQTLAREEAKTERNERDIQDLFKLVGSNAKSVTDFQTATAERFGQVENSITSSVGAVDKKVGNLKWWIVGGLGAATTILGFLLK